MLLAESSQGGNGLVLYGFMALLFVAMYFFMIRPQQRRRREIEAMQAGIGAGDEVVTIGGLYGTVTEIDDECVLLEVAPGITNRYARGAISRVVQPVDRPAAEVDASANRVVESD